MQKKLFFPIAQEIGLISEAFWNGVLSEKIKCVTRAWHAFFPGGRFRGRFRSSRSPCGTEKDNIAVMEVMVERLDWRSLRERLEHELSQHENVTRAQKTVLL